MWCDISVPLGLAFGICFTLQVLLFAKFFTYRFMSSKQEVAASVSEADGNTWEKDGN